MTGQFANGYALLIGVNETRVERWALPDVAKDITALTKVLTHPERCGYEPSHVRIIASKDATRQGILDGLEWLQERIQVDSSGNTTAIVYYSGHGWRDASIHPPEFYLIPYDVREARIELCALRAVDLVRAIGDLRSQRLLVMLDCCHAGGMAEKEVPALPPGYVATAIPARLLMEGEGTEGRGEHGAKSLETLGQGAGRAVLSSSLGKQRSYVRRDRRMSIFTYHLIEALTGHAQPQEGASEVLVSDVMSYVWRHVPQSASADWGAEQEPDYQVNGNFPIALLMGGKGLSREQLPPDPLELFNDRGTAKSTYGDAVHGDQVGRDKVGGDKITIGSISGSTGIALGSGAHITVYRTPDDSDGED
jgi:uncharacterized caspase-like protein